MIGIVGGVGPYAGLDLAKNVFDNTLAQSDQDHLDLIMLSLSRTISDRTEYLMGRDPINPSDAIANVLLKLEKAGATIAGIPCNTAHANEIFSLITNILENASSELKLLNMVDETIKEVNLRYPRVKNVGLLTTTGAYKFSIYSKPLEKAGFHVIVPDFDTQENIVHAAIYDLDYGIKAKSNPVTKIARNDLMKVTHKLINDGADIIIKGCTEIALAIPEIEIFDTPTIDPSLVLARSLIKDFAPKKLKPIEL
jgi:aspartate racemase